MKLKIGGFQSSLIALCSPLMDGHKLELPQTAGEWQEWLSLAILNRVETQIYKAAQRRQLKIPDGQWQVLEARTSVVVAQNQKRRAEALRLFQALQQAGIQVVVLKGNAIAEDIYNDLDYKQMNDFDLLFRTEDLEQLEKVYQNSEYLSVAALDGDLRQQEKYSHHWPPFFSRNMHLFIGTHWNVVSPFSKIKIPPALLWSQLESFQFDGQTLQRLSKEVFLLHLCVHLSPYKLGLKELADVYNFIFCYEKQIQWPRFIALVRQVHGEDSVYRAFAILNSLFDLEAIALVVSEFEASASAEVLQEVRHRTHPPIKALYIRTGHVSKIEKNFGFFSLSDQPSEKAYFLMKMWKGYLWAPWEECFRLCHEIPDSSLWRRFIFSWRAIGEINKSFIADLGVTVFILVTIRHHIELARSVCRRILGRPCLGIKEKAAQLGLSFNELKALAQLE